MPKTVIYDEKLLLFKIAKGDEIAFCTLFDYYSKFVYSFGYKLVRSADLAEEIVQDVFMKIWETRDTLTSVDNFGGYLRIVVRNHSLNVLRHLAKRQRVEKEIRLIEPAHDTHTQHAIDYKETIGILEQVLDMLPDQQRKVYTLCHFEGMKYEEAAQSLHISVHTVHYHMKSALKNIRAHFAKRGIAYQALLFFFLS